LIAVLVVQVALGGALIVLVATDNIPFVGDGSEPSAAATGNVPRAKVNRFNAGAAFASVERQVAIGPRPAGSRRSRSLAERIRRSLPGGHFQPVPGGLRNVVGTVPGRERARPVVIGAHYDTKDLPGFVGANDGASGVAVLTQLAKSVRPRRLRWPLVFIAFDGEESPRGTPPGEFEERGLRGSRAIAPSYRDARAMILLDFVGQRGLRIPREGHSNRALWRKLRDAARRAGVAAVFPAGTVSGVLDDHLPFRDQGVPSIDLIDFSFPCFHRRCDNLSQISRRSLDATGEAVLELLPTL
jgi:hypothetical protein